MYHFCKLIVNLYEFRVVLFHYVSVACKIILFSLQRFFVSTQERLRLFTRVLCNIETYFLFCIVIRAFIIFPHHSYRHHHFVFLSRIFDSAKNSKCVYIAALLSARD